MRVTPIKEIIEQKEDGDKVLCVKGTISGVYEFKKGTGQHGEYTVQNIQIKDQTGQIKAALWSQPQIPPSAKGRNISIECREGKDGWIGCNVKEESWQDKKTGETKSAKVLKVTQWGIVILDGGAAQPELPHDRPSGSVPVNDFDGAKKVIARNVSLYVLCRRAAYAVLEKEVTQGPGESVTPENLEAALASATSCVFIECCKSGLQSAMPTNLHKAEKAPEEAAPPPPPEPDPEPPQAPEGEEVPF